MLNREVGFALNNGHRQPSLAGPKSADSFEKVFLEWRTKIVTVADALRARRWGTTSFHTKTATELRIGATVYCRGGVG